MPRNDRYNKKRPNSNRRASNQYEYPRHPFLLPQAPILHNTSYQNVNSNKTTNFHSWSQLIQQAKKTSAVNIDSNKIILTVELKNNATSKISEHTQDILEDGLALSIEDAVTLTAANKRPTNTELDEEVPKKKQKEDFNKDSSKLHSFDGELRTLKTKIKSQLEVVKKLNEQFIEENNKLKEMKVRKKSLVRKIQKNCRNMVKKDKNNSSSSDSDGKKETVVIDLDSYSSSSSDDKPSTSTSSVELLTTSSKSSTSTSSVAVINITTSTSKCKQKQSTDEAVVEKSVASKDSSSLTNNKKTKSPSVIDENTPTTSDIKTDHSSTSSEKTKNKHDSLSLFQQEVNVQVLPKPSPVTPIVSTDVTSPTELEIKNSTSIKNKSIKIEDPKSFFLDFPQTVANFIQKTPHAIKPNADNGLFNAVEPKLSSVVVSDLDQTFIMDIKIFNNRLFVAGSHGIVRQYDMVTHKQIMDYPGHSDLVHCLLPTAQPVGFKRLISGGFDQNLLIHCVDTGVILHSIASDRPVLALCDLMELMFMGCADGKIMAFSLDKDREMGSFSASDSGISCLSAIRESNRDLLFVGSNIGEYSIWDAKTFVKINVITPPAHVEAPIGFVMLQKQRILAYTKNYVHFIPYVKSKNPTSFNHFNSINSLCLTKNYAIIGGMTGNISVYRLKGSLITKNPTQSLHNSVSSIISLTFYNNTIISGDKTGRLYFNRLIES